MKTKTIKKVITEKFNDFLSSIKDEKVKNLVKENSLISGGCIASMLLKEKVNDYDIYFTNKETVLAVANYYKSLPDNKHFELVDVDVLTDKEKEYYSDRGFREPGRVGLFTTRKQEVVDNVEDDDSEEIANNDKEKYKVLYISPNAISLSDKIQIIMRFYGTPQEIHSNYDFVHCTNFWLSKDNNLHLNQLALESILAKNLIYIGSKYPIASIIRTRKFINRGWSCNAGNYLKMCFQVSKLNMDDISVLEDQLIGVDIMYFITLLDALKSSKYNDKEITIDYNYICTIIDKIFN